MVFACWLVALGVFSVFDVFWVFVGLILVWVRGLGDFWWFNSVGIWVSPLGGVGLVGGGVLGGVGFGDFWSWYNIGFWFAWCFPVFGVWWCTVVGVWVVCGV